MNCGYCAEYCPFDAIKMDHDYELASYDRTTAHIYDKPKLSKEYRYWQTIAPNRIWEEAEERGFWEHTDVKKAAKKAGVELPPPTEENMHRATTVLVEDYEGRAAAAPAAADGQPAAIAAPAGGAVAPVQGDPVALAGDESQPLAVRAAAALKIKEEGAAKTRKLTSADRKLISAVQKLAKAEGTTIEELAAGAGDISQMAASAAPPPPPAAAAPAPAAPAPAAEAPAEEAVPAAAGDLQAQIAEAKDLEARGKAKEIKLTGDQRRQISAAKKAAKEAGIEY